MLKLAETSCTAPAALVAIFQIIPCPIWSPRDSFCCSSSWHCISKPRQRCPRPALALAHNTSTLLPVLPVRQDTDLSAVADFPLETHPVSGPDAVNSRSGSRASSQATIRRTPPCTRLRQLDGFSDSNPIRRPHALIQGLQRHRFRFWAFKRGTPCISLIHTRAWPSSQTARASSSRQCHRRIRLRSLVVDLLRL